MVFSPFRAAISHYPRKKPTTADDPYDITQRPRGSRRPHPDAKVRHVRRLIENTTMTYREISQRTGVPYTNISRWTNEGNWTRPLDAPRAPPTRCRAGVRAATCGAARSPRGSTGSPNQISADRPTIIAVLIS